MEYGKKFIIRKWATKKFQKKHLEWETKLNKVTEHLKDLYKSNEETIIDLHNFSTQLVDK